MKQLIFIAILFLTNIGVSQDNIFLKREFWKSKPNKDLVDKHISEGHDITELNRYGFDGTVYALLENVDNELIKYLLSFKDNDVNKLTHDGRTYIFWAAYKDNISIMRYLLDKGAKTDIIDDKGYSLLNFAAVTGQQNPHLYNLLLSHGANIKDKTPKGANALLLLIPHLNDLDFTSYFTDRGLSLKDVDNNDNGIFNYVAQRGNKNMLNLLIQKGVPYKNLNTNNGNAFIFATKGSRTGYNSLDFFKYLESLDINPNVVNKDGQTPLLNMSYSNKDINSFNYFLSKGVDANQINKDGNNALMLSTYRNSLDIIKLLHSKTKSINQINKKGHSALTHAIQRHSNNVVDYLIENGADVNVIDKNGNNLVYHTFKSYSNKKYHVFKGKLEALVVNKLDILAPQQNGNTLYHLCVEQNSLELLNYIKQFKLNINAKNNTGLTALQQAVMTAKDDTIIKYLVEEGANINVKTEFNESLVDLAKENEALKNIDLNFLKP